MSLLFVGVCGKSGGARADAERFKEGPLFYGAVKRCLAEGFCERFEVDMSGKVSLARFSEWIDELVILQRLKEMRLSQQPGAWHLAS